MAVVSPGEALEREHREIDAGIKRTVIWASSARSVSVSLPGG
jgi:hypothetical protein